MANGEPINCPLGHDDHKLIKKFSLLESPGPSSNWLSPAYSLFVYKRGLRINDSLVIHFNTIFYFMLKNELVKKTYLLYRNGVC